MQYVINNREPAEMFRFFEEICAIPHGSGNEKALSEYLCSFAQKRGLDFSCDKYCNVLISKPASHGREGEPGILLQAHTDMVCEKLPSSDHDFLNDALRLSVKGDMLSATETTLGADNGIGVATMLWVLDSDKLSHPSLECLFTTSEETGMQGAEGFDYTTIASRRIINLDNEGEGSACCGCAGGTVFDLFLPKETVPFIGKAVTVTLSGLGGGHSGICIAEGRENAIILLSSLLYKLYSVIPFCLVAMECYGRSNVIPPCASATVSFYDSADAKRADKLLREEIADIRKRLCKSDKGLRYSFKNASFEQTDGDTKKQMCSFRCTSLLLSLLGVSPNGVLKFMPDDRSQVLSSVNLGALISENNVFRLTYFSRSCSDSENARTLSRFKALSRLYPGSKLTVSSSSPGWQFRRGGSLQAAYEKACHGILNIKPSFDNIHAGLECGIIISALNKLDGKELAEAISIGPNLFDIHSPSERVSLSSCERFCKLLAVLLKNL